jgi:SAM-dependent methyltransferase
VTVDGVDLAGPVVSHAHDTAEAAGLGSAVRFHIGDAERIPFRDNTFDALVTECSFCTFPSKSVAAAEFARVLRPGGRLGMADVTVSEKGLPGELTTLAAWVACIADARPLNEYIDILARAGLRNRHSESHDGALLRMIDQIEARVHLARMTRAPALQAAGVDTDAVIRYIDLARNAATEGLLGYTLLLAEKR